MLYISDEGINRRHIDSVVERTKMLFSSQGIDIDEKFVTILEDNGYSWTWDDGKDFDNEDYREEFNHLMFSVRNSSAHTDLTPRIQFLWNTRK